MRVVLLGVAAVLLGLPSLQTKPLEEPKTMNVKRITPILFVEEIEPCAKFRTERLGFQKTAEVPEGNKLGFLILQKGNFEIMYQTYGSVEKDMPSISSVMRKGPTFLYVEVDDLDTVISAVRARRSTCPCAQRSTERRKSA